MTPVSRVKLDSEAQEKVEGILISELCRITNTDTLLPLINNLLSESEKLMLAKRMAVFVMAEHGIPDSKISEVLHMTRVTVAKLRLSYQLSKERKDLIVETIKSESLWKELKPLLKDILFKYAIPAAFGRIPK